MAAAHIVLAQGAVDGVNRVFSSGEPYVPGTVAYILNGRIHNQHAARGPENDFGFVELDASTGTVEVDVAPLDGDVVQLFFQSRRVVPAPLIDRLTGVVTRPRTILGTMRDVMPERLTGVVAARTIQGIVREPAPQRLAGVVITERIVGVIKDKCP